AAARRLQSPTGGATGVLPRTQRGWIVYARSTTIEAQPSCIDAGIAYVCDEVMPALQTMDGYIGLSLMVEREAGRCIATSAWGSEEAMHASEVLMQPIRSRAAEAFRGPATVAEWEIAVLHRNRRSAAGACVRAAWLKVARGQLDRSIEFYKTSVLPAMREL